VPPTLTCSSNASSLNGMPAPFSSCRIRLRLAGLARSASNTPRSFSVGHKHTHTHRTVARCRAHSATRFKSTGYVASVLGHKPRESVASGSAAASKQASKQTCLQTVHFRVIIQPAAASTTPQPSKTPHIWVHITAVYRSYRSHRSRCTCLHLGCVVYIYIKHPHPPTQQHPTPPGSTSLLSTSPAGARLAAAPGCTLGVSGSFRPASSRTCRTRSYRCVDSFWKTNPSRRSALLGVLIRDQASAGMLR
jgi:hypothetical protein